MSDSKYKLICSLKDSRCWIENKETGMLSEPFTLEDIYINKLGMYEDLRIVYSFTVALKDMSSE